MTSPIEAITLLKEELDSLRPLRPEVVAQVEQKLRIEANYHSNAIEGNTLTFGETRSLILHGLTAHGKPMRDHLDIEGHDSAVKAIEAAVKDERELTEVFIRNLHGILLKEPYESVAETPEGIRTRRTITVGDYKTTSNNVLTSAGEIYYFTPPDQVKPAMSDLIDWYRRMEDAREHPIIIAATFHYRFVRIHPFDDGNGRMARLLMNMILIRHGYTGSMIHREGRDDYIDHLERADRYEDLTEFINYIASCCEYSLNLHLKAARGESIEDVDDIDKEIALFKQSLVTNAEQIPFVRQFVISTLHPFEEHCRSKAELLSDAFASVRTYSTLHGTTIDGQVSDLSWLLHSQQLAFEQLSILDELSSISFRFRSRFSMFQARQDISSGITVENTTDNSGSTWAFFTNVGRERVEFDGRDLEELKKRFNALLRTVMRELQLRST
ncbi:MAG: Fic family protein [Dehalococcoidia bacterium]|nr:Fic family protein [Dehalococcoidia bacterium]